MSTYCWDCEWVQDILLFFSIKKKNNRVIQCIQCVADPKSGENELGTKLFWPRHGPGHPAGCMSPNSERDMFFD